MTPRWLQCLLMVTQGMVSLVTQCSSKKTPRWLQGLSMATLGAVLMVTWCGNSKMSSMLVIGMTQYAVSIVTRCSSKNNSKVASRLVIGDPRHGISSDLMRFKGGVKSNPKATPRGWDNNLFKKNLSWWQCRREFWKLEQRLSSGSSHCTIHGIGVLPHRFYVYMVQWWQYSHYSPWMHIIWVEPHRYYVDEVVHGAEVQRQQWIRSYGLNGGRFLRELGELWGNNGLPALKFGPNRSGLSTVGSLLHRS